MFLASALRLVGRSLCDSQLYQTGGTTVKGPADAGAAPACPHEAQAGGVEPRQRQKAEDFWDWSSDDACTESSIPTIQSLPLRPKIAPSRSTSEADSGLVVRANTPTSISTEASNLLKTEMQSESCGTEQDCFCIPADASLLEGVRLLLSHHLARGVGDAAALTPSQQQLFERHVQQLASYTERLQQAVLSTMVPDAAAGTGMQQQLEQEAPLTSSRSDVEPKPLRLRDGELLEIYRMAQQEAGKEADWRGLPDDSAAGLLLKTLNEVTTIQSHIMYIHNKIVV